MRWNKRIILTVAVTVLFLGGLAAWLVTRGTGNDKYYDSDELKKELAVGKCSGGSFDKLKGIKLGASEEGLAKTKEALGRCYSYDDDLKSAMQNYYKASEHYSRAGMQADADRLKTLANNLVPLIDDTKVPATKQEQDELERKEGILGT